MTNAGTFGERDRVRWAFVAALLCVTAVVTAFWFFRLVSGEGRTGIWGDLQMYYYPQYRATVEQLMSGALPLWNPYQLCGTPWLPAIQIGPFYPPHLIYALLPTNWAMAASSWLHLTGAAIAMVWLSRRIGLGYAPALLSAVLFTMRGQLPGYLQTPNLLETAVWLVPGIIAIREIARGGGRRWIALLAGSTAASLLAGYPQFTVYSAYTWAALLLALLLAERPPLSGWARAGAAFGAGIALGAALGAIQLVPAFTQSLESTKHLGALSYREMFPRGTPGTLTAAAARVLNLHLDLPMSLGFVGLSLLPFSFAVRERRALAIGTALVGLFAIGVALGPVTPLFDLYLQLPAASSFRMPSRILLIREFCFALLAALGLEGVRRLLTRVQCGSWRPSRLVPVLIVGLAIAEVFAASATWFRLPYFEDRLTARFERGGEVYEEIIRGGERVLLWNPGIAPALPPKLGSILRMRSVDDYEAMSLQRSADYFSYAFRGTTKPRRRFDQPFFGRLDFPKRPPGARGLARRQRLLDLAGVRHVLAPWSLQGDPVLAAYARAAGLSRSERPTANVILFTNPAALPRAFVTYRATPAPPTDELLAAIARADFDPLVGSYVERHPGIAATAGAPDRGRPARIVRDELSLVEIDAELDAPGLVVLADSYHSRWQARVDGEPTPVLPTNYLFRGVAVPAGRHRIRFEYRPVGLMVGATVSAGATVLFFLVVRRRERPGNGGEHAKR